MSAPVDVLAVLDRLIGNARTMAGMTGDHVMRDNLRDGEKARAAVAELIEAAQPFRKDPNVCGHGDHYTNGLFVTLGQIRRLDAALARIGGAA